MTEIIKAPTKAEIETLVIERDKLFEEAIHKLVEQCILYINESLLNHNWGTLKRLDYGSKTVEIPFDIFREYYNIDPMSDLPYNVMEILKPKLDEAGYYVFSSTGSNKAIYFSLIPKDVKK